MTRAVARAVPRPVVRLGAWTGAAACADRPDLPWTTDTPDLAPVLVTVMAGVCAGCPVFGSCLAYAAAEATGGYWAGADRDTLPTNNATAVPATAPAPAAAVSMSGRRRGLSPALVCRASSWWDQMPLWGAA